MPHSFRLFLLCLLLNWCLAASSQTVTPPAPPDSLSDRELLAMVEQLRAGDATDADSAFIRHVTTTQPARLSRIGQSAKRVIRFLDGDADAFSWHRDWNRRSISWKTRCRDALANAESDSVRADIAYACYVRGHADNGCDQALRYNPTHAPCRYSNLNVLGRQVGTQRSLTGRFNYWCLADRYRQLAASTNDSRIANLARRAGDQYDRAGPTHDQLVAAGYRPGQIVPCSSTGGTTRARPR